MKNVLITGGTGSFGQAFTARLLKNGIDRIVIYSRGEHKQDDMARSFNNDSRLRFFIGDVRDKHRLAMAFRGIDTVVHAAALKIIPTCEYNPYESVQTNVIGAQNVCKAAIEAGILNVVLVSTDKAASPLNCYGACKLVAEKIFIGSNFMSAGAPHFSVVRYGNVDGSNGSVMPYFKKLAADGVKLPVTDPRMTRFSISMESAIDLVLKAIANCQISPGTIWIPKLPSFSVMDLVKALSDQEPIFVGIRGGEKLHETLLTEDEARLTEDIGAYYVINGRYGSRLKDGFSYNSGANKTWLSTDDLKRICSTL